jgi:hypothetical protein
MQVMVMAMIGLNPADGHMALLAGIGLALMGLSVPGNKLARVLSPAAFVVGLGLVVFAVARPWWIWEPVLALVLILVWLSEKNRPLLPLRRGDEPVSEQPQDSVEMEAEDSQQWGDNPAWVQHILVTNSGPRGRFKASLTTDIAGLEKPYGKAMRLLWEQTNSGEMELGNGEQGRLRLASFLSSRDRIEARFFAIPTSRHKPGTGYQPTHPYFVKVPDLTFDLCVRNADTDETAERSAKVVFSGNECRPHLSLWAKGSEGSPLAEPEPTFPILIHFEGMEQDDEFVDGNTRLRLHLRAVNRTDANARLVLHIGIAKPDGNGFRLWQQARTPGAHPLAILTPHGRAEPSLVPAKDVAKLEPEFLFAKEYVRDIRREPPKGAELGIVASDYLWVRARDLISDTELQKPLEGLEAQP